MRRSPPLVEAVWVTQSALTLDLQDGRSISAPLHFYPPLALAGPRQRNLYEIHGATVYWADLDFRLSSSDLLQGKRRPLAPDSTRSPRKSIPSARSKPTAGSAKKNSRPASKGT